VRACFTALAVAHMLCLDVPDLVARSGVVGYVARCQTPEGARARLRSARLDVRFSDCRRRRRRCCTPLRSIRRLILSSS
jgi:prenyltransferase beta subunit